jgi:hypothetical protein
MYSSTDPILQQVFGQCSFHLSGYPSLLSLGANLPSSDRIVGLAYSFRSWWLFWRHKLRPTVHIFRGELVRSHRISLPRSKECSLLSSRKKRSAACSPGLGCHACRGGCSHVSLLDASTWALLLHISDDFIIVVAHGVTEMMTI